MTGFIHITVELLNSGDSPGDHCFAILWFDRDRMSGRMLPVEETGDAKHPVAVGASGIAADLVPS